MISREEFITEVKDIVIKTSPKEWRFEQSVFNYIEETYGLARYIQFEKRVDCFYNDSKVDDFLNIVYDLLGTELE